MKDRPGPADRSLGTGLWPDLALVLAVTVGFRLLHLDAPPHFDEMYHVLAARGWLETGEFRIGEGVYDRVRLFTLIVAGAFAWLGESLVVARLPSVLFGTLWVVAVLLWTRALAGRWVALGAALFLAVYPGMVDIAQFARFYALHGLVFWLAAIGVYHLSSPDTYREPSPSARPTLRPGTLAVLAGTGIALVLAYQLQVTSLIGGLALAAWILGSALVTAARPGPLARPALVAAAGMVVVGLAAIGVLTLDGTMEGLLSRFRSAPLWALEASQDPFWYHRFYQDTFGPAWIALPAAAGLAAWRFGRIGAFAVTLFLVPLVVHSFAGAKHERYLIYAFPFLALTWSMALVTIVPPVHAWLRRTLGALAPPRLASGIALLLLLAAGAGAAYLTPVNYPIRRWVVPDEGWRPNGEPDWAAASQVLVPLAERSEVVIVAGLPKALFFLGRGDIGLSASELSEIPSGPGPIAEFTIDHRTGRPYVSAPESFEQLRAAHPSGLVVIDGHQWNQPCCVTPATSEWIASHLTEVTLPPDWLLRAYRWDSDGEGPDADR